MSRSLLDLSGKIDPTTMEFFEAFSTIAKSVNISFFVVGAFVRDMILTNVYNIEVKRFTRDIDLGIYVNTWSQFEVLKNELIKSKNFEFVRKPNRFKFKNILLLDIIPFGEISSPNKTIAWPPEREIVMGTLGVEEAYNHSLTARLRSSPKLELRIASLSGLALMKLIAWDERYPERKHDAIDFRIILKSYLDAGNEERLYEQDIDLIKMDYQTVGARMLGRDIAKICRSETAIKVLEILDRETGEQKNYNLVVDMREDFSGEEFEEKLQLLEDFKLGVLYKVKK